MSLPELPEVETIKRALATRLVGRRVAHVEQRRPDLRWPLPTDLRRRLEGRTLTGFARRAKYIEAFADDGTVVLMHLGMSGRLVFDGPPAGVHEHLTFGFDDGTILRFVDPRRFGALGLTTTAELDRHPWLAHLGVEPLGNAFSGETLRRAFAGRVVAVKLALMDQRLVVGVGNIYASESLFRAGIRPAKRAGEIGPRKLEALAGSVRDVLGEAIAAGGSSLRDYVQSDGELGMFQHDFRVYDRAGVPCPACGEPIRRMVQGGRATFWCKRCQR